AARGGARRGRGARQGHRADTRPAALDLDRRHGAADCVDPGARHLYVSRSGRGRLPLALTAPQPPLTWRRSAPEGFSGMQHQVSLTVNGKKASATVESRTLLVQLLREHLGLTGTHVGCDTSQCGACVVHVNGESV